MTKSPSTSVPKPYKLVKLPANAPTRQAPIGHHVFKSDKLTGSISLKLTVKNSTFVASGVVAMGSDVIKNSSATKPKLIKVALTKEDKLIIPGSSFKGVVRSIYEAITASCICKTKSRTIPANYKECKKKDQLCPACRVFGAMDWQGLISFNDAIAVEVKPSVGFMPSLYAPRPQCEQYKTPGRKFYYHARQAINKGVTQGIPVQQAPKDLVLTTELQFMNLTEAELGTLLIVLGQDTKNPLTLKIGGGKPIGMGTVTIEVSKIDRPKNLRSRYLDYEVQESDIYTGETLKKEISRLISASHQSKLIQQPQLTELQKILEWPATREAPSGMY